MNDSVLTIMDAAAALRDRSISARALVEDCLARIETHDGSVAALHEVFSSEARARADDVDRRGPSDDKPLDGIPIIVKDNIATTLGTTSAGSRMLETYRSPFDATAVERLVAAGAIIIAKAHCDEFGMGSSNEHCAFAQPRNPWSLDHVPGGSSGGCAASVASGYAPAAIGSDTGGSIRQPAAFCGIMGLKPSYGRVSRWGLVAFGSSLDVIGPMARSVDDLALLLEVMAGSDDRDSTCADRHVPSYKAQTDNGLKPLRIGIPRESLDDGNDPMVNAAVECAVTALSDEGAEIIDVPMSLTKYAVATYYILATAEASSNLARYDGVRYGRRAEPRVGEGLDALYLRSRSEGFGDEVQRRIMLGTYVLSSGYYDAYYRRAQQVRRLIVDEYARAFDQCDVILTPTTPTTAFKPGSHATPLDMYLSDRHTIGANIAGLCALSMPCGLAKCDDVSLPIGLQFIAPAFEEPTLFRAARELEATGVASIGRPELAE